MKLSYHSRFFASSSAVVSFPGRGKEGTKYRSRKTKQWPRAVTNEKTEKLLRVSELLFRGRHLQPELWHWAPFIVLQLPCVSSTKPQHQSLHRGSSPIGLLAVIFFKIQGNYISIRFLQEFPSFLLLVMTFCITPREIIIIFADVYVSLFAIFSLKLRTFPGTKEKAGR